MHFTRIRRARQASNLTAPAAENPNRDLVFGQPVETNSDQPSIREIASHVAQILGCQTFPTNEKIPAPGHEWCSAKLRTTPGPQDAEDATWAAATGYGITALPGDNLVIVDSDGLDFLRRLAEEFPGILQETPITYSPLAADGHCQLFLRLTLPAPLDGPLSLKGADGREIASLRGQHSYGVGPGSKHPSGQYYTSNAISTPRQFDAEESRRLLALFKPPEADPERPYFVRYRGGNAGKTSLIEDITAILKRLGYKPNGPWLNGPCLFPHNHKNGDAHPSAGFNTATGLWHCFEPGCGNTNAETVGRALGLSWDNDTPADPGERPFAFIGALPGLEKTGAIRVELNIATELFRRGCFQAARFYDVLCHDAARHDGQHIYTTKDVRKLAGDYGMTRDETMKTLRQMVKLGLIVHVQRGVYQRVGLKAVQSALGLGDEYGIAYLPPEAYSASPVDYCRAVLDLVERYLPEELSSETIAKACGVSKAALYKHENVLGVIRLAQTSRVGLATATAPSFVKVFDGTGRYVFLGHDKHLAAEIAEQIGGKAWAWRQRPSRRVLPERGGRDPG